MEALTFLKFWRPTSTSSHKDFHTSNANIQVPNLVVDSDSDLDEGDDSFFELELTLSDFDNKRNNNNDDNKSRFDSNEEQLHYSTKNAGHNGELKPTLSDVLSKRKILPIEPSNNSKPQSPMALLKSAPKLRVSIFKKSKSTAPAKTEKLDCNMPKHEKQEKNNKLFTVKFKVEEVSANLSMFTRACSLRKTNNTDDSTSSSSSSSSYDAASKRFSKDAVQKYLKLIKPFYVKASKKNEKIRFSGQLSEASPASSPATLPVQSPMKEKPGNIPAGFRVVNRHLGKSKSASATATVSSPARRDDSLLLQHDGIQSAILHCKKSFHSSRDSSSLSRSTSSSSQETLSCLSSKDSSLFPRFSSDSSCEGSISARKSNEEGI